MVKGPKMTPFISWDGKENLQGQQHLTRLEKHLAGGLAFNSSQAAISASLEILGSRFQPISVIMPVNAPYDALMGVIHANARPVVTDINDFDFQADTDQVKEALEGLPEAVVYLNRPGGLPVNAGLLEAVQDVPTICDSRILPLEDEMLFTFNIYDLSVMVGEGAVLYSKNEEQLNDLKQVRADTKTELPEISSALAYQRQPQMRDLPDGSEYTELLDKSQKTGIIGYAGNTPLSTYLIRVNNAKLILTL